MSKKAKPIQPGDQLRYKGKGFLGYDKEDTTMYFVKLNPGLAGDYTVKYKDREMVVRNYEVEKA